MIFDKNFDKVLKMASQKYDISKIKYGESWKKMSIKDLQHRLVEEYMEWNHAVGTGKSTNEIYGEVLDIITVGLMLAERLRATQKG